MESQIIKFQMQEVVQSVLSSYKIRTRTANREVILCSDINSIAVDISEQISSLNSEKSEKSGGVQNLIIAVSRYRDDQLSLHYALRYLVRQAPSIDDLGGELSAAESAFGRAIMQAEQALRNSDLMVCSCDEIEIGTYGNQVTLSRPVHMIGQTDGSGSDTICIDGCLANEIQMLWNKGISTTGCCCGHNKYQPYIGVIPSDIAKMKELGYKVALNVNRPNDEDSFKPRSLN